ncbi:response regulator transcription factor [Cohnella zeiphila]|uniref:Response regulator n=1 Tax=Cohnella zeiphila TaxID=2761120 RepID=A0A7X0SNG5_9BACL|nr:response regulator [Cohnella zeiphila]MBB6733235.1 response regulator [Cohnella zeiphila]
MRTVMVVDDEKWIRRGLIQLIPWDAMGLRLVGEAGDGSDAFEMAKERKPDVLFLDMRMPGLDGKELLGMLRSELPELLTVVVSGYSDFEYTKEAIRQKAFDYLLKPVKREELGAVLEKALAELDRRDEMNRSGAGSGGDGNDWLRRLLLEREAADTAGGGAEVPPAWRGKRRAAFVARADVYRGGEADAGAALEELRERWARSRAFHFGGDGELSIVACPDGGADFAGAIAAERLDEAGVNRALAELQAAWQARQGVSVSLGVCEADGEEACRLREAFRQAKAALGGRRLGEGGALLRPSEAAAQPAPYPREREAELLLALQLGREEALEAFGRWFSAVATPESTVDQLHGSADLLIHSLEKELQAQGTSLKAICGQHPQASAESVRQRGDAASVRDLFERDILPGVLAERERAGARSGARIVREIVGLIENHYDQPMSLQQIADTRFLHPDYLSRLFKKTTGRNFVDYLTEVRIRKSLELMKVPSYKNYEIAQKVGYEDYRYFSQIFKRKTGRTIGEYRSRIGSGTEERKR